ncbi:MAG: SGNH/GDSL hydrolase family protein [Janthinobacterium lividum]
MTCVRAARLAAELALVAGLALLLWPDPRRVVPIPGTADPFHHAVSAFSLAVLGDSNSHSYQDRISFALPSSERGGALRVGTLQWTEVLARLRGEEIDLGPWVAWGRWGPVAAIREGFGLRGDRSPRKEDFLFNFANSGAACRHLTSGRYRQVQRLVALMDEEPARWRRGAVVIRIGLNDWGGLMEAQARDPNVPETRATIDMCIGHIGDAMRMIHSAHPGTRLVLVGVANESDDPAYFDRWLSKTETDNIATALKQFNDALRKLAASEPDTTFFDDNAWVRRHWGGRGANGRPDYKTIAIGESLKVTNTAGDAPGNAILGDHHAGLVYNTLWAQSMTEVLRVEAGLAVTPIRHEEVVRFVEAETAVSKSAAPTR